MSTQEPGFCYWLRMGVLVSYLSAVIGLLVMLVGVGLSAETQGMVIAVSGVFMSLQSMVFSGVLRALLWIVARLNVAPDAHYESRPENDPVPEVIIEREEEYDGIRHKPVLKRRRVE